MHAISAAPTRSPVTVDRHAPPEQVAAHTGVEQSAEAATELRRWYVFLGLPFLLAASFFMAAIGTGHLWLIGGTLVTLVRDC